MRLCHGDEPLGVSLVRGNRFLDHDVQAVLQRVDADGGVQEVRGGDDERVNRAGANHFFTARESLQARAILIRREAGREGIADRREFAAGNLFVEEVASVEFADIAEADDAETDVFHGRSIAGGENGGQGDNFR